MSTITGPTNPNTQSGFGTESVSVHPDAAFKLWNGDRSQEGLPANLDKIQGSISYGGPIYPRGDDPWSPVRRRASQSRLVLQWVKDFEPTLPRADYLP